MPCHEEGAVSETHPVSNLLPNSPEESQEHSHLSQCAEPQVGAEPAFGTVGVSGAQAEDQWSLPKGACGHFKHCSEEKNKEFSQSFPPPVTHSKPFIFFLGQGKKSKWMRTQREEDFWPILTASLALTSAAQALPGSPEQCLHSQSFLALPSPLATRPLSPPPYWGIADPTSFPSQALTSVRILTPHFLVTFLLFPLSHTASVSYSTWGSSVLLPPLLEYKPCEGREFYLSCSAINPEPRTLPGTQ